MNVPAALIEVEVETSSLPKKRKTQQTSRPPSKKRSFQPSAKTRTQPTKRWRRRSTSRTSSSKGVRSTTKQAKGAEEGSVSGEESTRNRRLITKRKLDEICKELHSVAGCDILT